MTIKINSPPVVSPIPKQNTTVGDQLTFTATASDADQAPATLSFSLQNAPAGAAIDLNTGTFTWTPTTDHGGKDFTFKLCVSDAATTHCQDLTIKVAVVVVPPDEYKLYLPFIAK